MFFIRKLLQIIKINTGKSNSIDHAKVKGGPPGSTNEDGTKEFSLPKERLLVTVFLIYIIEL